MHHTKVLAWKNLSWQHLHTGHLVKGFRLVRDVQSQSNMLLVRFWADCSCRNMNSNEPLFQCSRYCNREVLTIVRLDETLPQFFSQKGSFNTNFLQHWDGMGQQIASSLKSDSFPFSRTDKHIASSKTNTISISNVWKTSSSKRRFLHKIVTNHKKNAFKIRFTVCVDLAHLQ